MSQARAALQSRFTVIAETCRTSATSATSSPPKNRSSTTRAARIGLLELRQHLVEGEDVLGTVGGLPALLWPAR